MLPILTVTIVSFMREMSFPHSLPSSFLLTSPLVVGLLPAREYISMKIILQRWVALLLAAIVASMPPSALASAGPPPPAQPTSSVTLEVNVAADIVEAAELQQWIDEEARRMLDARPGESRRRGSLHVTVGGALYEYQVTITARRDGEVVGRPSSWQCECSNEELLERLREELPRTADLLVESSPVVDTPGQSPPPPRPPIEPAAPRIGAGEVVGLTVMVVGVAGLAAGAALVSKGAVQRLDPGDYGVGVERDYTRPGVPILVAGAGAVATGLAVYLLQRAGRVRRMNMAIAPSGLGIDQTIGAVLSGRFR